LSFQDVRLFAVPTNCKESNLVAYLHITSINEQNLTALEVREESNLKATI
jgi:hypothetical protein